MKKYLFALVSLLAIVLTACRSSSTGTSIGSTGKDLPVETQLAVGTLKLAGTDQDFTVDQVRKLVIYWEVYNELSQSDTAAQAEMDGLVAQIQETMTAEQMQAISDMSLTQQDVFASLQGVTVVSRSSGESTAGSSGMPAGGPPSDGVAPPDGGAAIPVEMSGAASGANLTQSAQANSTLTGTTGIPSALVEAVIQSLQEKIAG